MFLPKVSAMWDIIFHSDTTTDGVELIVFDTMV
jgi:hypothetical protein